MIDINDECSKNAIKNKMGSIIGFEMGTSKVSVDDYVSQLCADFDLRNKPLGDFSELLDCPFRKDYVESAYSAQKRLLDFIERLIGLGAGQEVVDDYKKRYDIRQKNLLKYEKKSA